MADLALMISMGFTEELSKESLKKGNGNLEQALNWIEKVQSKGNSVEKVEEGESVVDPGPEESANSLKCDECNRQLKDGVAAEAHAVKTGHSSFSESVEAEQKQQKMKELQERLVLRKEQKRVTEIAEGQQKETIRRATGVEMQQLRERVQDEERAKDVADRKREKEADRVARQAVRDGLANDKRERMQEQEERKRIAKGLALPVPEKKSVAVEHVEGGFYESARIQIRMPTGSPFTSTFKATDTVQDIISFLRENGVLGEIKLLAFPRRIIGSGSMVEEGLVPSAALVCQLS